MEQFETFLVEQCAPVLVGLKPGSMFPYRPGQVSLPTLLRHWNGLLAHKGVRITSVKRCRRTGSYLIYVYRPKQLDQILSQPETALFLRAYGYDQPEHALQLLTRRMSRSEDFPHEVGVFLGYPLADVRSFIENRGCNSLSCGCWKVYHEPQKAQRTFQRYRGCTESCRRLHRQGLTVPQLTSTLLS